MSDFVQGGGVQPISGTVTVDSEFPAAAALADNTANPTVSGVGAYGMVWDGSTWDRMPGTSADGTLVNLGTNNDVDTELPAAALLADNTANPTVPGVGSFPHWFDGTTWDRAAGTSADGALVNLGSNNDVQGVDAHDAAMAANPIGIGGIATTATSVRGAVVQNNDLVRATHDIVGRQVIVPHSNPEAAVVGNSTDITNTSEVTLASAQANQKFIMTGITVCNSHATVSTWVKILDGSGGTKKWQCYAVAAGGGVAKTFLNGIAFTENTAVIGANETTGSNTRISIEGYYIRSS